jgi:2-oxoglutarate dehydrogenase E1 component
VHIVVNNQIGFTTSDTRDARSSLYCTGHRKMVEAPVFHVNGDDPEAVVMVARIALDYRDDFPQGRGDRPRVLPRLGHNEQDEPFVTQPLMYKKIASIPARASSTRQAREGRRDPAGHGDELVTSVRARSTRQGHQREDPLRPQAQAARRLGSVLRRRVAPPGRYHRARSRS